MDDVLKCPWPYFGGKSSVANVVWSRIGNVDNFIEPFCGSAAVLLARPHAPRVETVNDTGMLLSNFTRAAHPERGSPETVADAVCETVNDLDPYLANAWRSIKEDSEATAAWADAPVDESYLHAIHRWLVLGDEAEQFRQRMREDPDFHDAKRAGRWVYGLCCWIGSGWCVDARQVERHAGSTPKLASSHGKGEGVVRYSGDASPLPQQVPGMIGGKDVRGVNGLPQGRPQLADAYSLGRGVHAGPPGQLPQKRPLIGGDTIGGTTYGHGVHAKGDDLWDGSAGTCAARRAWLLDWFARLRDRLRNVRVCCGDWRRVVGSPSVTTRLGLTGVFLDPPYSKQAKRSMKLYAQESGTVAHDVRAWCLERGPDPLMRICLAGYEGEGHEELEAHGWEAVHWRASGGYGNRTERGRRNAKRERLWFSPHCVHDRGLFDVMPLNDDSAAP